MTNNKISLTAAIMIAVNTVIGAGLFINPKHLTLFAGPLGFLGYLLGGLFLFPLLLCVAELARLHPVSGGLYVYSKEYISPSMGFLSGWSYFLSKTNSMALVIHVCVEFFKAHTPMLQPIPSLLLDCLVIFFLVSFIIGGMKIGGKVHYVFGVLKFIPLIFTFACGFIAFDFQNFQPINIEPSGLVGTIPVAIFAMIGFEMISSVGGLIVNPRQNIRRAMLIAFTVVIILATFFQATLFGVLGMSLTSTRESILLLGHHVFPNIPFIGNIFNGIVYASIFGTIIAILASNCWNFYTLAKNEHLPFENILTKISKTHVPWVSLVIQGTLGCIILAITQNQVPLQNMSVFAIFTTYLLCAIALFQAIRKGDVKVYKAIPLIAMVSCSYILGLCLKNIINFGISFSFLSIFSIGCFFAIYKHFFVNNINKKSPEL